MNKDKGHIINGHIPVKFKDGESPIKGGGRLICIDGGFCKAYQSTTGIAGYTLISNSYGLRLASHEPFTSIENAVLNNTDIHSHTNIVETNDRRYRVSDTDSDTKSTSKSKRSTFCLALIGMAACSRIPGGE